MQKSTLIEIIRSLDKKEVREIHKWLLSPAHNHREDVVHLFDCIVKHLNKTGAVLEKEQAWAIVFPKEPYNDAFMRQVMYFLLKAIEEYFLFTDIINDKVRSNIGLARIYKQRKLDKSYRLSHRLAWDALQAQPLRNTYFLQHKFFLEREEYEYQINISQNNPVNLQEMADALDNWFIAEKLQVGNSMIAHHKVFQKINYDTGLLKAILHYLGEQKQSTLSEPGIASHYYAHMAITQPSEEIYFDHFEQLIKETGEKLFSQSELRDLYRNALNYCTAKINQGRIDFARRAFEISRKGLEKNILFENNALTRYTFGNAVAYAIRSGEFDWAEQFIQNFQQYLDEKERNSIVHFNLSRVYFEKGDYDKAHKLLMQFEYSETHLNIIAKTMLLKIYYEQDEYDAFESLIDSMRIYLQRKEELDPARKNSFKNMLSLMKKILHLDLYNRKQREEFAELVRNTNPLAEREWLLKQAAGK
jgi:TolA-binding protein